MYVKISIWCKDGMSPHDFQSIIFELYYNKVQMEKVNTSQSIKEKLVDKWDNKDITIMYGKLDW